MDNSPPRTLPNIQESTRQAPYAPERPSRNQRLYYGAPTNLNSAFAKAANKQEKKADQVVPGSPSASDDADYVENEFGTF